MKTACRVTLPRHWIGVGQSPGRRKNAMTSLTWNPDATPVELHMPLRSLAG
jgi:hypothetical protein